MKRITVLMLVVPLFINAQKGVRFEEGLTWKQVLQKARAENKHIFVDCYATWCAPCKWMEDSVYTRQTVGDYYNEKFISLKVQMDTSKLDNDLVKGWYADAAMLRNRYIVNAYPTYLFFSPDGVILHKGTGGKDTSDFIVLGKDALDENRQYYVLLKKYRQKKLDDVLMRYLARKAKDVDREEQAHKIANDYLNRLPTSALFTKDNIQMLFEFTASSKDRGFVLFRDNAKKIQETDDRMTEEICKNIVLDIINKEEIKPYSTINKRKPDWKKIKSNVKRHGSLGEEAFRKYQPGMIFMAEIEPELKANADWSQIRPLIEKQNLGENAEFVVGSTVVFYLNGVYAHTEKNCKNLVAAASYYANSFPTFISGRALNGWGWAVFENSNDEEELKWAAKWSKRSIELEPESPEVLDTYANLLYKLGHVEEAIAWQEKAVELGKKTRDIPDFQENFIKMKNGQKTWPDK